MRSSNGFRLAAMALCVVLVGCATSRSELKIGSPGATPAAAAVTKSRAILIRAVTDERVFEQAPSDPSTPSLGFEGAANAAAEIKARAIGRKRNGFGQALGDILLENGQTVTGMVQDNLAAALRESGYRVTSNATEAGQSPLTVDVRVKRFWTWLKPGFWSLTLSADITTQLEVQGVSAPVIVNMHTEDSRQLATDSAWIELVDRALKEYRTEVKGKAATLPN